MFLIAGKGPERDRLSKMIAEQGLAEKVALIGHEEDVRGFLGILDIFVLPSYSEGMSNAILEAMASGVPIVVSDIPPNLEIFEKAKELELYIGETSKCGDYVDLARKLECLLDRPDLDSLGENGRIVASKSFSLDSRILKELAIYEGKM